MSDSTNIDRNLELAINEIKDICNRQGSSSQYFPYGGEGYKSSVRHYLESSAEISAGAVQPGSIADLCDIIKVIGKHKVEFAIKGGGHATNPKFSSTKGIQIYMCRFNRISVQKGTTDLLPPTQSGSPPAQKHSIVHVGTGCLFDELYREVVPRDLNIVGGSSIGGVGIAGWYLNGGYSLKSNQYGLGIDSILRVEIVLPTGISKEVSVLSEGEDKELFEAVKGGGNNFGIVTELTIKAHDQAKPVIGGLLRYDIEEFEDVKAAIGKFVQNNTDEKACIVAAFRYSNNPGGIEGKLTVQCFYDGPKSTRTIGSPFADFLKIQPREIVKGGGDTIGHEAKSRSPFSAASKTYAFSDLAAQLQEYSISSDSATELPKYTSYAHFDQEFSSIKEAFDTDKIEEVPHPQLDPRLLFSNANLLFNTSMMGVSKMVSNDVAARSGSPGVNSWTADQGLGILGSQSKNHIKQAMVGVGENPRGRWGTVMVGEYTKEIIDEIGRQASRTSRQMTAHGGKRVAIDIWPFTKSMFDKSTPAAWPHTKGEPNGPILACFLWEGLENDSFWIETMQKVLGAIQAKVTAARGRTAKPLPVYANTALYDYTTVEDVYGENLEALKQTRLKFDPNGVMDLTGGFKIPFPPSS